MPQLQVRARGEVLRVLTLEMRQLSIGRTPDNGLPLRDPSVAIRHAEIGAENGTYLLTDLSGDRAAGDRAAGDRAVGTPAPGEQSPTFVNGRRLAPNQPHRLEQGDEIQIGPFTLAYLTAEAPTALPLAAPTAVAREHLQAVPARPPIPSWPAPLPHRAAPALYTRFLPPFFQESEFLGRYLKIFEAIWEPLQARQDHIDLHFDLRVAPPRMLPWMAGWLGLPLDPHWPEARQRAWLREAVTLYRWRGTRHGLTRALETVYGLTPVLGEDPARPHTLRVTLLDSPDGDDTASREAITRFVREQVPAHTLTEVVFVDAPGSGPGAGPPGATSPDPAPPAPTSTGPHP